MAKYPTDIEAVRSLGVIDLPTLQKKANVHYSLSLDLFGSELSTNAANYFNAGLKGRMHEVDLDDNHQLTDLTYSVLQRDNGGFEMREHPALKALNARLRDDFTDDCNRGVGRWNKVISKAGAEFEIRLLHVAFYRQIGDFADLAVTLDGEILSCEEWERRRSEWLPDGDDREYIESLMVPHWGINEFTPWIAPPRGKIDRKPGGFEWVRLAEA